MCIRLLSFLLTFLNTCSRSYNHLYRWRSDVRRCISFRIGWLCLLLTGNVGDTSNESGYLFRRKNGHHYFVFRWWSQLWCINIHPCLSCLFKMQHIFWSNVNLLALRLKIARESLHDAIWSTAINKPISKSQAKCLFPLFCNGLDSMKWKGGTYVPHFQRAIMTGGG